MNDYRVLVVFCGEDNGKEKQNVIDFCQCLNRDHQIDKKNIYYYNTSYLINYPITVNHLINAAKNELKPFSVVVCIGNVSCYNEFYYFLLNNLTQISIKTVTPIVCQLSTTNTYVDVNILAKRTIELINTNSITSIRFFMLFFLIFKNII